MPAHVLKIRPAKIMKGSVELHGRNCDCKKATVPAFKMQVIGNKIMKNDELFSRLLNRRFR